jgi:AraC-like DNA-binding protein
VRAEPGLKLPLSDYFRFTRAVKQASRDETLYISARPLLVGASDFVISDAARTSTLAEGMGRVALAYNLLHGGDYNRVERRGRALTYFVDDTAFPYRAESRAFLELCLEGVLLYLHAMFCMLAGRDLTPALRRIHTRRPEARADTPLALWEAPVAYGAGGFGLTYDASVGVLPLAGEQTLPPDHAVNNRIIELIEQGRARPAAGSELVRQVRQALAEGVSDQARVARAMALSVATLRRRLAAERTSFRRLRHEVLNESAKRRLADRAPIGDVAEALGFSDCRSFTRAFKEWNGMSPSLWRARGSRQAGPSPD